jgi:hypothetical protein
MMRKVLYVVLAGMLLAGFSNAGRAAPLGNPNPALYGNDIDDSGLFNFGQPTLSVEIFDRGDALALGTGFEFGFYFAGDPGTQIVIFDESDVTSGSPSQAAGINFALGRVGDLDEGVVQDTFTFVGEPIGFYIKSEQILGANVPIFTQALLNPGQVDYAGTYPVLGQSPFTYLIAFISQQNLLLSASIVGPIAPVPLPGALGLWMLGLAGLALFRRRLGRPAV